MIIISTGWYYIKSNFPILMLFKLLPYYTFIKYDHILLIKPCFFSIAIDNNIRAYIEVAIVREPHINFHDVISTE